MEPGNVEWPHLTGRCIAPSPGRFLLLLYLLFPVFLFLFFASLPPSSPASRLSSPLGSFFNQNL